MWILAVLGLIEAISLAAGTSVNVNLSITSSRQVMTELPV
jgi:hypothetical protein